MVCTAKELHSLCNRRPRAEPGISVLGMDLRVAASRLEVIEEIEFFHESNQAK